MRLNYKQILKDADRSGACSRPLRAFAYFVENKMYRQAREIIVYHEYFLCGHGILTEELKEGNYYILEKRFGISKQVTYDYDGSVKAVYKAEKDGTLHRRRDIVDDLNENHPKYRIPKDYIYKSESGRELKHDPS